MKRNIVLSKVASDFNTNRLFSPPAVLPSLFSKDEISILCLEMDNTLSSQQNTTKVYCVACVHYLARSTCGPGVLRIFKCTVLLENPTSEIQLADLTDP